MSRRVWRRLRNALLRPMAPLLTLLFGALPWRATQALGGVLGGIAWRASRINRPRALRHLAIAFPELSGGERERLGRASFRHQMTSLCECLHLAVRGPRAASRHLRVEGWERVAEAHAAGRPLLLVSGHCGNWELLGAAAGARDLPLAAVVRRLHYPGLDERLERLRRRLGTRTIRRGGAEAPRRLRRALRDGCALLVLIDQDIRVEGVWVPFFGRPAYTAVGPAELALRHAAAVLPAFVERAPDGSHLLRIGERLELPDDPEAATAEMTRVIEAQIRRRPEQWVWFHRRWRADKDGVGRHGAG